VRADDLFVTVAAHAGPYVERELQRHIVFDQVEVLPLPKTLGGITVIGAAPLLATLGWDAPAAGAFVEVAFGDARLLLHPEAAAPAGSVTIHALRRQLPELIGTLLAAGGRALTTAAFDALRIGAGVPLAPLDAGAGVLPQEAGLESLVSYRKGCYLGQEIMARIEARGRLRRSLAGVRLEPPPGRVAESVSAPPAGTELTAQGRTVGRLGSAVDHPRHGWIALAVLRDDLDPAADLVADGWRAHPVPLPFDLPFDPAPG
jgi:folate-binding protein YgfZ